MTVRMNMLVLLGAVTVVIFIASTLSLGQTTPTMPVAVSGDADTGPETVSVVFQSGELLPSGDARLRLCKHTLKLGTGKTPNTIAPNTTASHGADASGSSAARRDPVPSSNRVRQENF